MKFTADSSVLVGLYANKSSLQEVERFVIEDNKTLGVSELTRIEVLNVLLRKSATEAAAQFEEDLKNTARIRLDRVDWPIVFRQAESLARRFSRTLRPDGHDLVIVAAAVTVGSHWFLSLDEASRQRVLAACAGLKVWPPLNSDEKGLVKHATRQSNGR